MARAWVRWIVLASIAASALFIVTAAISLAIPGVGRLCTVALTSESNPGSKPIDGSVLACFEFWSNRYQSLLAGLLAVAAATISIIFYRRQALFAQHSIIHARTAILREDVVAFQRAQSQLFGARREVERVHRTMQDVLRRAATIDATTVDSILDVSSQHLRGLGTNVRATISGRQADSNTRERLARFVTACDQAADQTNRVLDAALVLIQNRQPNSAAFGIDPFGTPEAAASLDALRGEVTDVSREIQALFEPASELREALQARITVIELLVANYDRDIAETIGA